MASGGFVSACRTDPPAAPVSTTSDTRGLRAGSVMVASLGADEFLVAGIDCRVQFAPPVHAGGKQMQLLQGGGGPL